MKRRRKTEGFSLDYLGSWRLAHPAEVRKICFVTGCDPRRGAVVAEGKCGGFLRRPGPDGAQPEVYFETWVCARCRDRIGLPVDQEQPAPASAQSGGGS